MSKLLITLFVCLVPVVLAQEPARYISVHEVKGTSLTKTFVRLDPTSLEFSTDGAGQIVLRGKQTQQNPSLTEAQVLALIKTNSAPSLTEAQVLALAASTAKVSKEVQVATQVNVPFTTYTLVDKPAANTLTVSHNGLLQQAPRDYVYDPVSGIVTFNYLILGDAQQDIVFRYQK